MGIEFLKDEAERKQLQGGGIILCARTFAAKHKIQYKAFTSVLFRLRSDHDVTKLLENEDELLEYTNQQDPSRQ